MAVAKLFVRLVKVCDKQKRNIDSNSELSLHGILQAEFSV